MVTVSKRPRPGLEPEYCKGCNRCVEACAHGCIVPGQEINALTGLIPVSLHLEECNGCSLCVDACPEPHGLLMPETTTPRPRPVPVDLPTSGCRSPRGDR